MILSLDVGFANTGYSIFENDNLIDYGVISVPKTTEKYVMNDYSLRCMCLYSKLSELITKYSITAIVGELPSGGAQSNKASVQMGMALATVSSVVSNYNLKYYWCTPQQVKFAATGKKSATKEEVIDSICDQYNQLKELKKNILEHVCDSVSAYLYCKRYIV